MSHLALKDLFSGFFVIDDEEEVEVPDKQQQVNERQQKSSHNKQQNKTQSNQSLKKSASRYTTTSEERNNRMSNYSKNNLRNVVTMTMLHQTMHHKKVQKCVYSNHVFSQIHKILLMKLKNCRATLVNLQRIDKVSAKRIIDFLSGTVYEWWRYPTCKVAIFSYVRLIMWK